MTRIEYFKQLSRINRKFHELRVNFEKTGDNKIVYLERLNAVRSSLVEKLNRMVKDDLIKLNNGDKIKIK